MTPFQWQCLAAFVGTAAFAASAWLLLAMFRKGTSWRRSTSFYREVIEEKAPPTLRKEPARTRGMYRDAPKEDPEAPTPGILGEMPDEDLLFVTETARWAIKAYCEIKTSNGSLYGVPKGHRNGRTFTIGWNEDLSLWVYKEEGKSVVPPITSPNFVAFLRKVRAHEKSFEKTT